MSIKSLIVAAALACCAPGAYAAFNSFSVSAASDPNASAVVCNFATGVATGTGGGTCIASPVACAAGANDVTPNYNAFNTWANTWESTNSGIIELYIPPGSNCVAKSDTTAHPPLVAVGAWPSLNLLKFRLNAVGASVSGTVLFKLGGAGICARTILQADGCSARIDSASASATTVTLTSASFSAGYISRFTVGNYMMVAGFDMQGPNSQPVNPHYFEYVRITAINTGTGVITFTPALTNTYLSTWPYYGPPNNGEPDPGGPATVYALEASWDTEVEVIGATWPGSSDTNFNGRSVIHRNVTVSSGGDCIIPSQNLIWQVIDSNLSACAMEVDKLIGAATFDNTSVNGIEIQSSSINTVNILNSPSINYMFGTAKTTNITSSTIGDFRPGPTSYGRANELNCTNSSLAGFSVGAVVEKGGVSDVGVETYYASMTGGVITSLNSNGPQRWAMPGTNLMWGSNKVFYGGSETLFRVTGVTQDATNTYIATNLAGTWPAVPKDTDNKLFIRVHPAPKSTFSNCTGSFTAVSQSLAGSNVPLFSYATATYHGTGLGTQSNIIAGLSTVWGTPVTSTWNVTVAYSATGAALSLHAAGAFDNFPTINNSTYAGVSYGPILNLRQTGARVATTASPVTCNGSGTTGCSGDTISSPGNVWYPMGYFFAASADISANCSASPSAGCPSVTITVITDQGVVNP